MMFLEALLILIAIVILAVVINAIETHYKYKKRVVMSFKESMDLAELPVVTFYQGEEKFNFLLDTGSNHSHISVQAAERIKGSPVEEAINVSGIGGTTSVSNAVKADLEYKNKTYSVELFVGEHLTEVFTAVKQETGVQVHGIIGNKFLNTHNYILDFAELIAYTK